MLEMSTMDRASCRSETQAGDDAATMRSTATATVPLMIQGVSRPREPTERSIILPKSGESIAPANGCETSTPAVAAFGRLNIWRNGCLD